VGKIFRPLVEQSLTTPLKKIVSGTAAPAPAAPAAIEAAPTRAALSMYTPPQARRSRHYIAAAADTACRAYSSN